MVEKLLCAGLMGCVAALALASVQQSKTDQPPLALAQDEWLPVPQQQNAPWPHGDDALSRAAATLFEQGLADPRGLEYREIEVTVGNPWDGGGQPLKTHGWVLPEGGGKKFAVAWNGLTYPLVSAGARADLRADWQGSPSRPPVAFGHGGFEARSVQSGPPEPLKAVLLLRLGEDELARRIWKPAPGGQADPYLALARDWTWIAFERAAAAHMRGDDRLALADARLLTRAQPAIEAEARRRGFKPDADLSNSRFSDRKLPLLPFLSQLAALRDDSERRLAKPRSPRQPERSAGIAALIDDLENVNARQWGQPGGVSLGGDPRVQALVQRGNEAVEPLLEALENDSRLTRSVSFGRDFFRSRQLISVSQAARAALADLLRVQLKTYDDKGEPLSRSAMAAQLRAYWAKMGSLSPAERFYATLKDDEAGEDQWLQAAANIVQPADVERHGDWEAIPNRKPGQKVSLRGEALRDGRSPSVSQLLARRSDGIDAIRTGSTRDHFSYQNAGQLALYLAAWDKAAATPVLKRRLARAWNIGAQPHDILAVNGDPTERFGGLISQMTLARANCGDLSAYDEYAAWMQKVDLSHAFSSGRELLKPLAQGAARPSVGRALDYLFNDPRSAWADIFSGRNSYWRLDFWQTPLPLTGAFRKRALGLLADRSPMGTITFHPREQWNSRTEAAIEIKRDGGSWNMGFRGSKGDPHTPPAGEKRPFRTCDLCAYFYSQFRNGPKFQLFWPGKQRDQGVLKCRRWLEARFQSR